jgi:predicted AAA+ superfamily ATPase
LDTIQRHNIRNIDLLERLIRFLFDNTGNIFSAKNIADYMKNLKRKVDAETIYNYINALESAFIIKKAPRYDIKGKEFFNFRETYYPGDISLTYAALGFDMKRSAGILETIIFTELERRGFTVCVGKINEQEIDFIGIRGTEKIYIQAAYLLGDNRETIEREFGPLKLLTIISQNMLLPWTSAGPIPLTAYAASTWRIFCWERNLSYPQGKPLWHQYICAPPSARRSEPAIKQLRSSARKAAI